MNVNQDRRDAAYERACTSIAYRASMALIQQQVNTMSPSLLQEQVAALDLTPSVRAHLVALLATYTEIKFDSDALLHQLAIEASAIGCILEEAGIAKTKIEGLSLIWHRGETTSTLDKTKLLAQGVTLAQIEAATTTKPKKIYFQIRGKNEVGGTPDE